MERILKKLIFISLLVLGATAKTASETDLTSDFTSTVDDQYPWSALLPPRGPTDQDTNEWRWTNTDRNDNVPIDRYLQSPSRKSSLLSGKDTNPFGEKKYDDKGSQSSLDKKKLNSLNNNSKWYGIKLKKSKAPKKVWFNRKEMIEEKNKKEDTFESGGVPELQIGCEGLEALPKESTSRESRSIPKEKKNEANVEYTYIELKEPPVFRVTPISFDFDYHSNEHENYEEMDELLRLKKLEASRLNKRVNRGDMDPEVASPDLGIDGEKLPTRGDLFAGRKTRSVGNMRKKIKDKDEDNYNEKNERLWGFGENDGIISDNNDDDDDDEKLENSVNEIRRIEEDKRRREWERRRNEEIERRRKHQQLERKDENRVNSEIDRIRMEYEGRLDKQREEQARKLQAYIERNRPIVVDNHEDRQRKYQEEIDRRNMENSQNNKYQQRERPSVVQRNRSHGPSSPPAVVNRDDEYRRRQEAQRRRNEEENKRRYEEQKRAQLYEQEKLAQHYEQQKRQRLLMEQKRPELGVISLHEAERKYREEEEERLKSLPVSAKIIIIPKSTTESGFSNRGGFDDDIDLPAINPNNPGLEAKRFPAPKTPKPPSRQPGPCVWAVTQCCPNKDVQKLKDCFEFMRCPGVHWDPNPCRESIERAAIEEVQQFYASADRG